MTKKEFLSKLRTKISILEDKEIEDIIAEYEGFIEEKVNSGLTEEEAVKSLGNIDEIAKDLLAAYKVKPNEPQENTFTNLINKISEGIDAFIKYISQKDSKDVIKIIIEIALILVLIGILRLPFELLKDLGGSIFNSLSFGVANIFSGLWTFLIELSYIVLSIVLFVKILEKRYLSELSEKIITSESNNKPSEKVKEEAIPASNTPHTHEQSQEKTSLNTISNICIIFLKIIVIFISVGIFFYLIGISIALALMIYLIIKGVTYFGILILLIALFLGGIFALELATKFCFNKKIKGFNLLGKLITIVILTGVGLTLSAVEIANTEIIYDNYYQNTKSITKEIPLEDNMTFYDYDKMLVDSTLKDTVKIEYIYPDFNNNLELDIKLVRLNNGYSLDTNIEKVSWNKTLLEDFINNLKDNKIYASAYDIEKIVYIPEANSDILTSNKDTFTKTYEVITIKNDFGDYTNVTLKKPHSSDRETVLIPKTLLSNIETGKTYNFTFEYQKNNYDDYDEIYENDIDDIFDNYKLIAIN